MKKTSLLTDLSSTRHTPLSLSDATCHICFEILVETVKLPCNHEMCMICATSMIENKSFTCPMCRREIPELFRSNMDLLIDDEKWTKIKETFPNEVIRRLLNLFELHKKESKKPTGVSKHS